MNKSIETIRQSVRELRQQDHLRNCDIAKKLQIAEGELIAAHVGIEKLPSVIGEMQVIRLQPTWPEMMTRIEPLGEVMALTRNEACVHEKIGCYLNASSEGHVGILLGEIDLRIFYHAWAHGFAVHEMSKAGMKRSLQFFDKTGCAIHKIFMRPESDVPQFESFVSRFKGEDQTPGVAIKPAPESKSELADHEIDVVGFRQDWRAMQDTHEFYGLLKRYQLSRTQALRLGEPEFIQAIPISCCKSLLESTAQNATPIMAFVGNSGMIQIHSGPVKKVFHSGSWINVMDPRFNLHLREDYIKSAWVVRKPTVDGIVTSVELFDAEGESIVMFFGERKPGKPELESWRALVGNLITASQIVAADA
ncbi:putative hemin transport protein [Polynucleobacter meluiroseus]|uniref:Putative hemin transport protein n=1 Tax=Polynucleobacter meluiroseus TaxID=1938814 RepID=A0A240DZT8_9BURK|nr:ChuX/HutX family heme-like substrate-binding protein [Polynucleobacter meluiroseus]SNX28140.1 putative hemin transport protein [Polynucleobacter meluiroseus]